MIWKIFPPIIIKKKNLYNIKNIWDLYFDNISKYKLKDVYKSKNVIFSKSKLNVYLNDYNNRELKKTFSVNIKINQNILNKSIFFFLIKILKRQKITQSEFI